MTTVTWGWAHRFRDRQQCSQKVCTSAERRSYSTNIGQEVFDTDLGKKLVFTGSNWYDLMGNIAE